MIKVLIIFMENKETIYAAPFIIVLAALLLFYFISAGRDLNRLDGTSRSPIISLFSETILGITTIRTFKKEYPSKQKFYKKLMRFQKKFLLNMVSMKLIWNGKLLINMVEGL